MAGSMKIAIGMSILTGAAWAGFGLSVWNYILEAVSAPKRARCVAYFNILIGFGGFAGALLGEPATVLK